MIARLAHRMTPCLLLLGALVAATAPAFSEPISRNVRIVIQRLPDEAVKCGLTETSVHDRVESVLKTDGWTIETSPAADYIYVNANLFFVLVDTHCVYSASIELRRWLQAADGRRMIAATAESGRLGIIARGKSSTVILEDIEELLKGVIARAKAEGL